MIALLILFSIQLIGGFFTIICISYLKNHVKKPQLIISTLTVPITLIAIYINSNSVDSNIVIRSNVDSNSVASNSVASNSVASNSVDSNSVASNSVASNIVIRSNVDSNSVDSNSVASNSVASNSVASNSAASNSVASNSVASNSVASNSAASNSVARSSAVAASYRLSPVNKASSSIKRFASSVKKSPQIKLVSPPPRNSLFELDNQGAPTMILKSFPKKGNINKAATKKENILGLASVGTTVVIYEIKETTNPSIKLAKISIRDGDLKGQTGWVSYNTIKGPKKSPLTDWGILARKWQQDDEPDRAVAVPASRQ